jgi:hypothetical protein
LPKSGSAVRTVKNDLTRATVIPLWTRPRLRREGSTLFAADAGFAIPPSVHDDWLLSRKTDRRVVKRHDRGKTGSGRIVA